MRIGNDEYVKQNESFGLTTLQDGHVKVNGSKMRFKFRGKSGQQQDIELEDPRIAKIVKKCRDIPGWELFQYFDEAGEQCRITSTDVNNYIRDIAGEDFTAKDFRTWGGTGWAALVFEELGPAETPTDSKKRIVEAIKMVSSKLGNRPATCKKYYVHPAILDAYADGSLFEALKSCNGARREEACVMNVVTNYIKKMAEQQDLTANLKKSLRRNSRQPVQSRTRRLFHGSSIVSIRSHAFRIFHERAFSLSSSSSSHVIGIATGAPSLARIAKAGTAVCAVPLRFTSRNSFPPRFFLSISVVTRLGSLRTISSAMLRAMARTSSNGSFRSSGITRCSPRDPVVLRNGTQTVLLEKSAHLERNGPHGRKIVGRRIEIEDHLVRVLVLIDPL